MSATPQLNDNRYSPRYQAQLEARARIAQQDRESTRKEKVTMILCAVLLGILFDYFFNEQRFGISVPLYALMVVGVRHLVFKGFKQPFISGFLLGAALLLSASYAIFNNETLRVLNVLAIPLALTGSMLAARYGAWERLTLSAVGSVFSKLSLQSLGNAPKLVTFSLEELLAPKSDSGKGETRSQVLWGLALALPLLVLVLMLLTSSDAVFSRLLTDRFTFLRELQFDGYISHIILTGLIALYSFGFFWSFRHDQPTESEPRPISKNLASVSALTVIGMLCAVYLLFTLVQFTYLYSPGASLPDGLTYADYARRGFFELVAAALVNMAVILGLTLKCRESSPRLSKLLRAGNSLLTVFTLNLLFSAFYRMHLYETAYGFTQLRLFVQFFMVFMAVSLAALLLWIWKPGFQLLRAVLITAVSVYVVLNFVNVDRLIAHNNLERYRQTQQLDLYHLSTLSVDAWPEITAAGLPAESLKKVRTFFLYERYPDPRDRDQWFEYNYHMSLYEDSQAAGAAAN